MDSKDERSGRSIDPGLRRKISISDDGAPDSVYVDGDLSGKGGSRRKVLIIDEDQRDRPAAQPAPRRSMDGRVRARRAAVRRALGRRRLVRAIGALVVLVVGIAVLAVLGSSWFGVRSADVRVSGNVYTNPVQLNAIIDDVLGTPVILVDTDAIEEQIDAIAWVAESSVRTDWPFGLVIDIREREPVLSIPGPDGLFRVLDADGRVLDVIDGWPFEYLLLTSDDTPNLGVAEFARCPVPSRGWSFFERIAVLGETPPDRLPADLLPRRRLVVPSELAETRVRLLLDEAKQNTDAFFRDNGPSGSRALLRLQRHPVPVLCP